MFCSYNRIDLLVNSFIYHAAPISTLAIKNKNSMFLFKFNLNNYYIPSFPFPDLCPNSMTNFLRCLFSCQSCCSRRITDFHNDEKGNLISRSEGSYALCV